MDDSQDSTLRDSVGEISLAFQSSKTTRCTRTDSPTVIYGMVLKYNMHMRLELFSCIATYGRTVADQVALISADGFK